MGNQFEDKELYRPHPNVEKDFIPARRKVDETCGDLGSEQSTLAQDSAKPGAALNREPSRRDEPTGYDQAPPLITENATPPIHPPSSDQDGIAGLVKRLDYEAKWHLWAYGKDNYLCLTLSDAKAALERLAASNAEEIRNLDVQLAFRGMVEKENDSVKAELVSLKNIALQLAASGADQLAVFNRREIQLMKALDPFAKVYGEGDVDFPDETKVIVTFGRTTNYELTVGDFRLARSALTGKEQ